MKKRAVVLFLSLLFIGSFNNVQSQSIAGVYSGVELSPVMGGSMGREDLTFYLREDKTFTNKVDKPGWRTAIDGTWAIAGQQVVFTFRDTKIKPRRFDIVNPGKLKTGGGYSLFKMDMANSIPKGIYEFKYASSVGGIGVNTPYVGVRGGQFIYFDGQGNFSQETEKLVSVISDNFSGGNSGNKSASGTYTIKEGELTLNFADGHTSTHSIFINKDKSIETMAFIGGDAFFILTEEEIKKKLGSRKTTSAITNQKTEATLSATSLVDKIRGKHGSAALDGLKSITVMATAQGLELKAITDLEKERARLETRQNGKLVMVEQLEGNSGWQWMNGQKMALTAQRVKEMQADFYAGLGGMRSSKRSKPDAGTIKKEKTGYSLIYNVNGIQLALLANDEFDLVGDVKQTANGVLTIVYSEYRNVEGLRMPFTEKHTLGNMTIEVRISQVTLNKATDTDFTSNM